MDLFILRHGKATREPPPGGWDQDRPLTPRGRKDTARTAAWMKALGITFDRIGTSPLVRARQTADIVAETLALSSVLSVWEELVPGRNREALKVRIFKSGESVLIIGHEPMLSELVSDLISGGTARIAMQKGGLARIGNLNKSGRGDLMWLLAREHMRG